MAFDHNEFNINTDNKNNITDLNNEHSNNNNIFNDLNENFIKQK